MCSSIHICKRFIWSNALQYIVHVCVSCILLNTWARFAKVSIKRTSHAFVGFGTFIRLNGVEVETSVFAVHNMPEPDRSVVVVFHTHHTTYILIHFSRRVVIQWSSEHKHKRHTRDLSRVDSTTAEFQLVFDRERFRTSASREKCINTPFFLDSLEILKSCAEIVVGTIFSVKGKLSKIYYWSSIHECLLQVIVVFVLFQLWNVVMLSN